MGIIQRVKQDFRYFKAGLRADAKETARLEGIKSTPRNFRTQAQQEYADMANKTKRKIPSYKKGGIVKKTGLALLHKGERVIPKKKKRYG